MDQPLDVGAEDAVHGTGTQRRVDVQAQGSLVQVLGPGAVGLTSPPLLRVFLERPFAERQIDVGASDEVTTHLIEEAFCLSFAIEVSGTLLAFLIAPTCLVLTVLQFCYAS